MAKQKMITVRLVPQDEWNILYYLVYENNKLLGTITDHDLICAFKKYKTKIIDISDEHHIFKFPLNILDKIMTPYNY
jgi:hypothetical protein